MTCLVKRERNKAVVQKPYYLNFSLTANRAMSNSTTLHMPHFIIILGTMSEAGDQNKLGLCLEVSIFIQYIKSTGMAGVVPMVYNMSVQKDHNISVVTAGQERLNVGKLI